MIQVLFISMWRKSLGQEAYAIATPSSAISGKLCLVLHFSYVGLQKQDGNPIKWTCDEQMA